MKSGGSRNGGSVRLLSIAFFSSLGSVVYCVLARVNQIQKNSGRRGPAGTPHREVDRLKKNTIGMARGSTTCAQAAYMANV